MWPTSNYGLPYVRTHQAQFPGQSEGYVRIGPFVYKHGFPWYLGPGLRRYASNLGTTNARYVHHGPYS